MGISRFVLVSIAALALAAAPSTALAEQVVPPGNSAANQYTETFPTAGGNTEAKKGKHKVTPARAIGAGNAKKLDSQGSQGREAAAVVAATAPAPAVSPAAVGGEGSGGSRGANGGAGSGGAGSGGDHGGGAGASGETSVAGTGVVGDGQARDGSSGAEPSGSSGIGEVLGQATGSTSSGGTGLLLPLAVIATVIWSVAFFLRRRRDTA